MLDSPTVSPASATMLADDPKDDVSSVKEIHAEILSAYHEQTHPPPMSSTPSSITDDLIGYTVVKKLSRSASVERRLSEATQFFEALGEAPPPDGLDRLIEDGESDDDSVSDIGTVVETASLGEASLGRRQSVSFHSRLPEGIPQPDFCYKGIHSNPPEVTKIGLGNGNYAILHRKAWLEVSDTRHRYGKNLRLYYRHWESVGYPFGRFFDWLDSAGEASGEPIPELAECPRSQLDTDTVWYIKDESETRSFALEIRADERGHGVVYDCSGRQVCTGPDGWIFVLRDNVLYGAEKITSVSDGARQRFHHSTFFGGKAVAAAGILVTDDNGRLQLLFPHSGHYRPGEADMQRMLLFLYHAGVDLRTLQVDIQQLVHSNRQGKEKRKKMDTLILLTATTVAHYLSHKARLILEGVFDQIHQLNGLEYRSIREALAVIDPQGGHQAAVDRDSSR